MVQGLSKVLRTASFPLRLAGDFFVNHLCENLLETLNKDIYSEARLSSDFFCVINPLLKFRLLIHILDYFE